MFMIGNGCGAKVGLIGAKFKPVILKIKWRRILDIIWRKLGHGNPRRRRRDQRSPDRAARRGDPSAACRTRARGRSDAASLRHLRSRGDRRHHSHHRRQFPAAAPAAVAGRPYSRHQQAAGRHAGRRRGGTRKFGDWHSMTTTALHDWLAPGAVRQTNDDRPRSKGPETLDCRRQIGQDDCRTTNRTGRWHSSVTPASAPSTRTRRCNSMHRRRWVRQGLRRPRFRRARRSPRLQQALDYVREGDVLLVWKLDRLGRSLAHLIGTVTAIEQHGVGFRSITEAIDTTTPGGRLIFLLFGALWQFERDLIRERTRAGLTAATARGRMGGRKPVVDADKLERARGMIEKGLTVREAANRLKISKTALYEALRLCARNPVAWHNRDKGGRDGRQELAD